MNVYWERIERILAEQGMSINGFAKYIGLPREPLPDQTGEQQNQSRRSTSHPCPFSAVCNIVAADRRGREYACTACGNRTSYMASLL